MAGFGGQHNRYGVHTSWEDVALFTYINKIGLGRQTTEAHFVGNAPEVKRMDKHFAKPFAWTLFTLFVIFQDFSMYIKMEIIV